MSTQSTKLKVIAIGGPTAAGKTDLAVQLAVRFRGAVINADSRQIYSQLDIGTAKPNFSRLLETYSALGPVYEYKQVPHYLFNTIKPDQTFSVVQYKKLAEQAIKHITSNGDLPILAGGTGLYLKAVIENLQFPKTSPNKRLRLGLEKKPLAELVDMLKKLDPQSADVVQLSNKRRVIRALEVFLLTGKSFAAQQKKGAQKYSVIFLGLKVDKQKLEARIKHRTQKQLDEGLEDEVKALVERYGWSGILGQTVNYQEWQEYFEKRLTKKALVAKLIQANKKYAKRQITWFRAQKNIHWISGPNEAEKLVKKFLAG